MGMIMRNIFHDLKGFDKVYDYSYKINHMITKSAQKRLEIIGFFNKYGLKATMEAFNMSKPTIYRWRKIYFDSNRDITSLNVGSTRPKNTRKKYIDVKIINEIKRLRLEETPNMGKKKIKINLDKYCKNNNLKTISESTIGRIIKDKKIYATRKKITHFGKIKHTERIKNKTRKPKGMIISKPGDLLQVDVVIRWDFNLKRYIVTGTDVYTKKSFAYTYTRHTSFNAKDFMKKLETYFGYKIKAIQTDNGSEFHKHFTEYLEKSNIIHYWNYKGKPFLNGNIERFNRTIQDEFVDWNVQYMDDIEVFNQKLNDWIEYYNNKRLHWSLNFKTPNQFLKDYLIINNLS